MSCIVAVLEHHTMLLGGDSAGSSLAAGEIYTFTTPKVFAAGPYLVGFSTSYRLGHLLRYRTELPDPPSVDLERFMATTFADAVRLAVEAHGFRRDLGEFGSIMVCVRGQLFVMGSEFQVVRARTPYGAIGAGRHHAFGALYALAGSGKSPRRRAEIALRAAQAFNPTVREPFVFVEATTSARHFGQGRPPGSRKQLPEGAVGGRPPPVTPPWRGD